MKRGDIVTVSLQGEYGKPRPALIVQTDKLPASLRIGDHLPDHIDDHDIGFSHLHRAGR